MHFAYRSRPLARRAAAHCHACSARPKGMTRRRSAPSLPGRRRELAACLPRRRPHGAVRRRARRSFIPSLNVLTFPAWDCLPYDRVSPNGEIVSRRIDTLTRLAAAREQTAARRADHGQRAGAARAAAPAVRRAGPDAWGRRAHPARPAAELFPQQRLYPHRHGARAGRVRGARRHRRSVPCGRGDADPARFLRRHARKPARLRPADAALDRHARRVSSCARSARSCSTTPRSSASARATASVRRGRHRRPALRIGQRRTAAGRHGALAAVLLRDARNIVRLSARRRGVARLSGRGGARATGSTRSPISTPPARRSAPPNAAAQHRAALPPGPARPDVSRRAANGRRRSRGRAVVQLSPFALPDQERTPRRIRRRRPPGEKFRRRARRPERQAVRRGARLSRRRAAKPAARAAIAAYSEGSADRLATVLRERGVAELRRVADGRRAREACPAARGRPRPAAARAGLRAPTLLSCSASRTSSATASPARRAAAATSTSSSPRRRACPPGDLVVHAEHGIGRYEGLETIDVAGAPHDCLKVLYAGDDRLFVPVENIEVLSRYGSEERRRAARPARRGRLAVAQGAGQAAHPRDRRRADPHRRRAPAAPRRDDGAARGDLRGIRRPLPLSRDRRPAARDRGHAGRHGLGQADGPADLRRCRLRQDRGGVARRLHRGVRPARRSR